MKIVPAIGYATHASSRVSALTSLGCSSPMITEPGCTQYFRAAV